MKNSFIKWLWILVIAGVMFALALFVLVSFTKMPDTQDLENPKYEEASIIYAEKLEEIGKWYRFNRKNVSYEELNPHLVNALISTEDERFRSHSGIDMKGTARAFAYLGKRGGASTLTQQLAKLFFTDKPGSRLKRVWQKMKEWVIAIEFEKRYTKGEILAMYLNKVDFLYDSSGIAAASQTYFGKPQKELTLSEAATLVGMLKNPSYFNPKRYPEVAQKRRNVVMFQMKRNDHLDQASYDEYKIEPVDISNFKREVHYKGLAPYFRSELSKYVNQILREDDIKKSDGTSYNIYRDGLKVYTTIDIKMQNHAEDAMKVHMRNLQKKYFTRWAGLDPWTYKADSKQKSLRKDKLNKQIRQSERYRNLRTKYLGPILSKISSTYPESRMWDIDIIRMLEQAKDDGYLTALNKRKVISKKQSKIYNVIMNGEHWSELTDQWVKLSKATRKVFNEKTKMRIFAYTDSGERDADMTPLDSIKYHSKHMQLGSISIEPGTGYVRTWVGGIGNKYFKYDHITSNRQVGSTFKPFLYTTAISQVGMSPCMSFVDEQYYIPANDPKFGLTKVWAPANSSGTFSNEKVSLKEALKRSLNSISMKLMMELGSPEPVRDFANEMGIPKKKIPPYPSICLGTPELNVLEMTAAYAVFANNGEYVKPVFIKRIEDKNGKTIYNAVPEKHRAINELSNYTMVEMLKHAASFVHNQLVVEFGGKTGTTNDYVDGWFMGITPNLVTGTWVGGEDPWIRFLELRDGQGGVMARPFFIEFMKRVEGDKSIDFDSKAKFDVPLGDLPVIDCSLYEQIEKLDNEVKAKDNDEIDDQYDDEFEEELDDQ